MGTVNRLTATPLVIVFVFLACGAGLLVLTDRRNAPPSRPESQSEPSPTPPMRPADFSNGPPGVIAPPTPLDFTAAVAQLHHGMPRAQVERLFQSLAPGEVDPVDTTDGRVVYRVRHTGLLLMPMKHLTPQDNKPFIPGPHNVTLEFDARLPGHPLCGIEVTSLTPGPPGS